MGAERNGGKEKQSQSTEGVFLLSILIHFLVSPFSFPSVLFKHGPGPTDRIVGYSLDSRRCLIA